MIYAPRKLNKILLVNNEIDAFATKIRIRIWMYSLLNNRLLFLKEVKRFKVEFTISKSVKLCLHLSYIVLNTFHFHFDETFHYKYKIENSNLLSKNNQCKIRESLFTFRLYSAEHLSFWRDFLQKMLKLEFWLLWHTPSSGKVRFYWN